jgi:phosphatidylglycerol:prolipoprotein diacylglycerol transferase
MPVPALIEMIFDPQLQVGEVVLRWQTLGVTAALLAGIALAAIISRTDTWGAARAGGALVVEDLVYVVLAAVPGAVLGGRLAHGLVFWDVYLAQPDRLLDPQLGSLSLLGAVVGGSLSAAVACRLLGAPVRGWADAAALPVLVAVAIGKLAQFLGGSGQGALSDLPWAVAFLGAGPWVSANADMPAHAAQLYEAAWSLLGIPLLVALASRRGAAAWFARGNGLLFLGAVAWFTVGRVVVGFTWRDDRVLWWLNAEQLLALLVLVVVLLMSRAGAARYRGGVPQA